jgi:hypothetical protein
MEEEKEEKKLIIAAKKLSFVKLAVQNPNTWILDSIKPPF